MRIMKTGEPCPCCGQAIPAMLPVDKQLLASIVAEGLAIQDAVRTVEHGVVEGQEAMTALTPPNEPKGDGLYGKYTVDNAELASDIINWVGAEPNEPLTQADLDGMDYDKVWIDYEDGTGEWALVCNGYIYSIDTLEGAGLDFVDYMRGEKLEPHGYKVYRRPPEGGDSVEQDSLLTALRRLRVETGSLPCLGCGYDYHCSTKGCAILREAEQRIIRQAALIRRLQIERKQAREENPK